jgi:hypothetical protein
MARYCSVAVARVARWSLSSTMADGPMVAAGCDDGRRRRVTIRRIDAFPGSDLLATRVIGRPGHG